MALGIGPVFTLFTNWLLGAFARLFTVMLNNFLAMKIVLGILFIVILPVILNNAIYWLLDDVFNAMNTFVAGHEYTLPNVSFSGLLGYFMVQLGIPDCLSVVLSGMALRFAMSWIPFVGPR